MWSHDTMLIVLSTISFSEVLGLAHGQTYGPINRQSSNNKNFLNQRVTRFSKVWDSALVPSACRSSAINGVID